MQSQIKSFLISVLAVAGILCVSAAVAMPSANVVLPSANMSNQYNQNQFISSNRVSPAQLKLASDAIMTGLDIHQKHINSNELTPQDQQIQTILISSFPETLNKLPYEQFPQLVAELGSISYDLAEMLVEIQTTYTPETIRMDAAANIVMILGVNLSLQNPLLTEDARLIINGGFAEQLEETLMEGMLAQ